LLLSEEPSINTVSPQTDTQADRLARRDRGEEYIPSSFIPHNPHSYDTKQKQKQISQILVKLEKGVRMEREQREDEEREGLLTVCFSLLLVDISWMWIVWDE